MKLINRGARSELYDAGNGKVLKLYNGWTLPDSVAAEFRVSKLLHSAGLPVARPYEMVEIQHRQGILFDFVEGESLREFLARRPWKLWQTGKAMARLHAQIQALGSVSGLRAQDAYLDYCMEVSRPILKPFWNKIAEYRERLSGGSQCLCHGDFSVENIRQTRDGSLVLLDWCDACLGAPLSDVARAWLLIYTPSRQVGFPVLDKMLSDIARNSLYKSYSNAYFALRPENRTELQAWIVPMAAARLSEKIPGEREWLLNLIKTR